MKRAFIGIIGAFVILTPLVGLYQGQQDAKKRDDQIRAQSQQSAAAIQQQNSDLLNGIQDLLDRPVITVRTIRREVNRKGVRTVVITRTITKQAPPRIVTKIVYRTRIVYRTKIVYVCRLPNGRPCP